MASGSSIDDILARYDASPKTAGSSIDDILARYEPPKPSPVGPYRDSYHLPAPESKPDVPHLPPADSLPVPQRQTSRAESFGRGVVKGATMNFADEGAGTLSAAPAGGTYAANLLTPNLSSSPEEKRESLVKNSEDFKQKYVGGRDAWRMDDDAAEASHPGWNMAGQLAGGIATPLPGPKGAGLLGKTLRAGAEGLVSGAGGSNADLTKGELKDFVTDTVIGGGASAVAAPLMHGAGKLGQGALKRVDSRLATNVLEGVPAGIQDKALKRLGGQAGIAGEMRGSKTLTEAAKRGPAALSQEVGSQMDEVGGKLGEIYKNAADIPLADVRGALEHLKTQATDALDGPRVAVIEREIASLEKLAAGREVVKAKSVHDLARRYEGTAESKQIGRDMYGAVTNVLQDHLAATGGASKEAVQKLNTQYSRLAAWDDLATAGAKREARVRKPGLADWAKGAIGAAGVYNAGKDIEDGKLPSWTTAVPLAFATARPLGRAADSVVGSAYRLVTKGGDPAEAIRKLIAAGMSRLAATKTVEAFGKRESTETSDQPKRGQ